VAVGEKAAAQVIALRTGDGRDLPGVFAPAPGPGVWQPTPPAFLPALTPWMANVHPLLLLSPSQFRPGPPPALTSLRYARELRRVQRLGGVDSTRRTPAQTATALFWSDNPAAIYQRAFRTYTADRPLGIEATARLFAMTDVTAADSYIACFDAKYFYGAWRPVTAIRNADEDGNPATSADPGWLPLVVTPNHPEYPAAHGCVSAAIAEALRRFQGFSRISLSVSSAVTGTTRSFSTAGALDDEIVRARVLGGLHFRNSVLVGETLGKHVAAFDLASAFTPVAATGRGR
jgi:hypothetical protein